MTATDIVRALEAGLITENEAIEQGQVDRLSDLYERLSAASDWRSASGRYSSTRASAR